MASWFRKPVNIAITVGAAILAVAAVVLLVWGITHHTESALLEVCWVEGPENDLREARYVEGAEQSHGACEGSEELVWSSEQVPITLAPVAIDGTPMDSDAPEVRVLQQVVADLNRQVAFELYRLGGGLQPSDAEVAFGALLARGAENPPPGYTRHTRLGRTDTLRGYVVIRSDVLADERLLYLVLEHELLHLAGLAHDDFPASIMYPYTREEWDVSHMSTAHVTDFDVNLLQARYRRDGRPLTID